jgi:ABC-type transport system involved in cytochrome bd biosynthesis fused ATPase/permease subunit
LTPYNFIACFLACRFAEQQQQRTAAVAAGLDALKQHQTELHMSAAELGAAARLKAAEQQLTALQQVLQQADAEHAAKVEQIIQQLTKVCSWRLPAPLLGLA